MGELYVLGLSAFYHDSAAALIHEGMLLPQLKKSVFHARSLIQVFLQSPFNIALREPE